MKQKAIIVDLDGTLCDVNHRVHFVEQEPKDWRSFHTSLVHDPVNPWCLDLIIAMKKEGVETVLLTGRPEYHRAATESWLAENKVPYAKLIMRKIGDKRGDEITKWEFYEQEIAPLYQVLFVVEDRLRVVKMWREKGIVCLQCDWGDF